LADRPLERRRASDLHGLWGVAQPARRVAGASAPPAYSCEQRWDALSWERLRLALAGEWSLSSPLRLVRYITELLTRLGAPEARELYFIDVGEPAAASLGRGVLVLSLGLLATLEDEAQLAFVLARELSLERAGWPQRRLQAALARTPPRLAWLKRPRDPLVEALELSLRVGFGPQIEGQADREALVLLVASGYDPAAATRALRLLEAGSLSGRGGRFLVAAERARWLESSRDGLPASPHALINREVYRRAVGGFRVYSI